MATKRRTTRGQLNSGTSEKAATQSTRVRVREGTQVAHAERLYAEGEQLEAPEGVASEWLVLGLVEEVESTPPRSKSPS